MVRGPEAHLHVEGDQVKVDGHPAKALGQEPGEAQAVLAPGQADGHPVLVLDHGPAVHGLTTKTNCLALHVSH